MISSNLLKLFEYCIQPYLQRALKFHSDQFGFFWLCEGTPTQIIIAMAKEIIEHYNSNNSNVYACFFGPFQKSFDKINHFKMLEQTSKAPG